MTENFQLVAADSNQLRPSRSEGGIRSLTTQPPPTQIGMEIEEEENEWTGNVYEEERREKGD